MKGELVRVTVVRIGRDKVRLGFEADLAVTIHQAEVARRIEEAKA